jgi:hypothetical protein
VTSGTANFSKFGIRDSFTAGFSDQALFARSRGSTVSLLAKQFALGGGSFTNPLMVDNVEAFLQMEFNWRISQKTFFTLSDK